MHNSLSVDPIQLTDSPRMLLFIFAGLSSAVKIWLHSLTKSVAFQSANSFPNELSLPIMRSTNKFMQMMFIGLNLFSL
jgi:hypothetical protein